MRWFVLFAAAPWGSAARAQSAFVDASERLDMVRVQATGSGYAGVAVVDVDADGDLDLFFANGAGVGSQLLANDGTGHFTDVTAASGLSATTATRGVIALDVDNDGCIDLLANGDQANPVVLYRNACDGTFTDHTAASGLRGASRNNSVHAADVDGDGFVDVLFTGGVIPSTNFPNTLYRNQGDGTFVDVSAASGLDTNQGACAATFTHFDDDGHIDLLVGNCATLQADTPFEVFVNQGDGTFADQVETSRVWEIGRWMGLALLDADADGRLDFFATNSGLDRSEPHVLYRNNGDGTWTDIAADAGVAEHEFGWGTVASDFDLDGFVDLYFVGKSQTGDNCASPGLLFFNAGDGTFAAPEIPIDLSSHWTSGLAVGDLDGDGFDDLLVVTVAVADPAFDGRPVLLLNQGSEHHGLQLRLQATAGDPMAIGARVFARVASGLVNVRELHAGSSYLSSNAPWPTIGLGSATEASVCVQWPQGGAESFGTLAADGSHAVVQGAGTPVDSCAAEAPDPEDTGSQPTADTGDNAPTEGPPTPDDSAQQGCGCHSQAALGLSVTGSLWVALAAMSARRRTTCSRC